ncbi:unnamed protein product [Vitrella brassicaformis CCMP3155]|uniref:Uncharacterized protein n=1 Tax=Vitrella brassicaformis (strain CCMP3155) TaxID=1169540 RepID=A0A0G4GFB3_VITBC|nr:unnamed protein product [Vitrella brassicaformis CCMP3155]|eukprot:CEM28182.1 unnamed protein product [Vitrella brassicaformis CCMP3155]
MVSIGLVCGVNSIWQLAADLLVSFDVVCRSTAPIDCWAEVSPCQLCVRWANGHECSPDVSEGANTVLLPSTHTDADLQLSCKHADVFV